MNEHFEQYGYLGVFLALLASGLGFPIPEELPVITAGIMVAHGDLQLKWYVMLPVVMAGVVIGDALLYGIGRYWGTRLLDLDWVKRRVLTPEKRAEIEKNFHDRGIMILLGARFLPGIRSPIFIMAGVLRVPLGRFLLADALYAIPGVNLLFWLSYLLTDQVLETYNLLKHTVDQYRPLVMTSVLSAVAGALIQKYLLTRKVSTGDASKVPAVIARPAEAVVNAAEMAAGMAAGAVASVAHAAHVGGHRHEEPKPAGDGSPNGVPEGRRGSGAVPRPAERKPGEPGA